MNKIIISVITLLIITGCWSTSTPPTQREQISDQDTAFQEIQPEWNMKLESTSTWVVIAENLDTNIVEEKEKNTTEMGTPSTDQATMKKDKPAESEPKITAVPMSTKSEIKTETEDERLKRILTPIQYEVTQKWGTETPFENAYWDNKEDWIYVDIISGVPLYSSTDKYDSGTGWPSFTKPISSNSIEKKEDYSVFAGTRIEVIWAKSGAHLWHVFNDWPKDKGWMRYCINSASLAFIPKADLEKKWYAAYKYLFE